MLIPVYFTVAGFFKMNNSSTTPLLPGTLLTVVDDGSGTGTAQVATASTTSGVVGVAADGFRTDLSPVAPSNALGYAADIVVNPWGDTTRSQDRISDLFRETLASGKMTVYSGSGTFRTDQYDTTVSNWSPGKLLYSNAAGLLTNVSNAGGSVGMCVGVPTAFPSGVAGTDIDGSISLGTFLTFNLRA